MSKNKMKTINFLYLRLRNVVFAILVFLPFLLAACSRPAPEAERQRAIAEVFAKWKACVPDNEQEKDLTLAIVSVTREQNETSVRLAAYAVDRPTEFDLPVYLLSRGRWLINEKGRAYLLDEQCREYKLKDRKPSSGREPSSEGRVKLETGQVFEVTLSFPRLPDDVRMGVLVYGRHVLPFSLAIETR